jgi:hypothetical protein
VPSSSGQRSVPRGPSNSGQLVAEDDSKVQLGASITPSSVMNAADDAPVR